MTKRRSSAPSPVTPEVVTFGCRLNAYESEVMKTLAQEAGEGKRIFVNTCAVTKEAERQARQTIRKLARENPDKEIVVTGCAAQIDPDPWAVLPGVTRVMGNLEKLDPKSYGLGRNERIHVTDIMQATETTPHLIEGFDGRARAFVQVQQGCDHRCTFCIIPYGRGNSRSVPLGPIVDQVRTLVEAGTPEIVLTGVDLTSYGPDLPGAPTLGQMIRRLLGLVPDLKRLRISSIDSIEVDDELFRLFAEEERIMPHLHLSLQSGDDMILKRMKRRHLRNDAIQVVQKIKAERPDVVFGADLIAGFPTENEEMFQNSLRLVDDCALTHLHVFPYSERPGTPAAKMPQVDPAVRKDRAQRLRQKGEAALSQYLDSQIGQTVTALVEQPGIARTDHFAFVTIPEAWESGSLHRVRVSARNNNGLVAENVTEDLWESVF